MEKRTKGMNHLARTQIISEMEQVRYREIAGWYVMQATDINADLYAMGSGVC